MRVIHDTSELAAVADRTAFVPTMGALHRGHGELVRRADQISRSKALAGVLVSVFVNPTQFNEQSDFARYPRTLEADVALAERAGAAWVFAPDVATMYPAGLGAGVPRLPATATKPGLEDALRPGHFAGVCQVVGRLFELVRPSVAVFGEKDWQQLAVIREMTTMRSLPIEIVGVPTVREDDGLALSSRNVFLTPVDRVRAVAISRALRESANARAPSEAGLVMRRILAEEGIAPEYAVVRDANTLLAPTEGTREHRALIAARVGNVRLIDNARWAWNG